MGIQIPQFAGITPTKVESSDGYTSDERYIWHLRSKDEKGLDIKIEPANSDNWNIYIYIVEWNGSDYIKNDEPISKTNQDTLSESIESAENNVLRICSKNNNLEYIKDALF